MAPDTRPVHHGQRLFDEQRLSLNLGPAAKNRNGDLFLSDLQHWRSRQPHGVQVDGVAARLERTLRDVATEHFGQREHQRFEDVLCGGLEFDDHDMLLIRIDSETRCGRARVRHII